MRIPTILLLAAVGVLAVATIGVAQSPGNGISKNTWAASEPLVALKWMLKYLPVETADDSCGNDSGQCKCGQQGRVALKVNEAANVSPGFGIHTVNCSKHSSGSKTIAEFESIHADKFGDFSSYDAFMDHNVGFAADSLDSYISAFKQDGVKFFPMTYSLNGNTFYSVLFTVPNTMVVLEIISDTQTVMDASEFVSMEHPRHTQEFSTPSAGLWTAIKMSRATSDIERDIAFFKSILDATVSHQADINGVKFASLKLSGAETELQLVQRPATNTTGSFGIKDYEEYINGVHSSELVSAVCGFDKWMDNHFGYDTFGTSTDEVIERLKSYGAKYHVWRMPSGPRTSAANPMGPVGNIYFVDPTGFSVQYDGPFYNVPSDAGTFDPELCGKGSCSAVF